MDYLLLIIGLVMLFRRRLSWVFAIIIILASTYLQLPLTSEMQLMIGPPHNVSDTGMLLYLVFFFYQLSKHGFYIKNSLQKPILYFLLFLLLNGLLDLLLGANLGDVIRYLRNWAFLTIIFVIQDIKREEVLNALKIIFWVTFGCCIILILQYLLGVAWIGYSTKYISQGIEYVRGAKPPSYAILCFVIAVLNIFQMNNKNRILTSFVFILPVLLTLKMSYFTTIIIILAVYYIIKNRLNVIKFFGFALSGVLSLAVLFAVFPVFPVFPVFHQRLNETIEQGKSISSSKQTKGGNFTYRINHFTERFEYVAKNPIRCMRGIGYVQEQNFHQNIFKLGQPNAFGRKSQLDTGDIAWSLLIIRLGVMGIILYLFFYLRCMNEFYRRRKDVNLDLLFFAYMAASLFFMSLGNALIAESEFFIFPLLIYSTNENNTLHIQS